MIEEENTNSDVKIGQYYILQSISPDSDICITREEIRQLSAIISGAERDQSEDWSLH